MDEVQGPVAECQPTTPKYSSVTITQVENGYLIEARDRTYQNQRNLIALEVSQVQEYVGNIFS